MDQVKSMTETKLDNDVIDHKKVVYVENETELSWLIGSGVIFHENQIGQLYDWSYGFGLRQKQY